MTVLVRKVSLFSFTRAIKYAVSLIDPGGVQGTLKLASLTQRVSHPIWQYGLAVASVGVALGITEALEPRTTLRTRLFYIAIIGSAWFGGIGPGLLALFSLRWQ